MTRTLSDDSFEGRAPATPGEEKSVAYIVDRFAKAGLKPGNGKSWFQDVPLLEITADPSVTMHLTSGGKSLDLAYKTDMVALTKRAVGRSELKASEVVFVGHGVSAPERGWNDYAGLDVRGKTVIILADDPDWQASGNEGPFEGRTMTYHGMWTYKFEEAARQGAAGAFLVHNNAPNSYGFPWGVVVSSFTGPQLHLDDGDGNGKASAVEGWMSADAARKLVAFAGRDFDKLSAAATRKGFSAVPLGAKLDLTLNNTVRRQTSKNVVGILPGRTRPKEYIVYTAHWDHLGRCEPVNGDDICNGAVDNASGVGGLVSLAEAHAKAGPAARSLLFLAVTAEESMMLGSQYYAEHPLYPLRDTVAGLNMDSLNVWGRSRDVIVVGLGKTDLEAYLARAAAAQGRVLVPERTPGAGSYYRSDHFSFAKLGVPVLNVKGGADLRDGGVAAGMAQQAEYRTNRYHKPSEEYDPKWDWSGAAEDMSLYYTVGRELAESTAWPNWNPTAEFRAIRDASRPSDGR